MFDSALLVMVKPRNPKFHAKSGILLKISIKSYAVGYLITWSKNHDTIKREKHIAKIVGIVLSLLSTMVIFG